MSWIFSDRVNVLLLAHLIRHSCANGRFEGAHASQIRRAGWPLFAQWQLQLDASSSFGEQGKRSAHEQFEISQALC